MKRAAALLWLASCSMCLPFCAAYAAQPDARPPNRLTIAANGVRLTDVDDGGGGSINYLHYITPDALVGIGAEHQFIADSKWTFGSLRGSYAFGSSPTRTTVFGELNLGEGDEAGRDFDYGVAVLGIAQSLGSKLSLQLETRQIDVDRSEGNLPKLGVTIVWTPQWLTSISYAHSIGGNLGTELTSARLDRQGQRINVFIGGATGTADPVVLNLQPGLTLPVSNLREGFAGIGISFLRGQIQLVGDYLESGDSERITVTLSFTAFFRRSR